MEWDPEQMQHLQRAMAVNSAHLRCITRCILQIAELGSAHGLHWLAHWQIKRPAEQGSPTKRLGRTAHGQLHGSNGTYCLHHHLVGAL